MKVFTNLKRAGIVFVCLTAAVVFGCFVTKSETASEAAVPVMSERVLVPGGNSVGVRMDVKGVLIVGLEEIDTKDGNTVNPGLDAGLEIGDTILEINGKKVYKASEVQELVNEVKDTVKLKVQRKDRSLNIELSPVVAEDDGLYKLGVWIKDKTAGIGTLTFYDPETKKFGALGHGITDIETGTVLSVNEGELLNSRVESVKEGKVGTPGEIHGIFYEAEAPLGALDKNTKFGIFGSLYNDVDSGFYSKPLVAATQQQIEEGPAYILTTISGDKIEKFDVEIERLTPQTTPDTKSMIIRVTDKDLLERTGGIVQGMSGSPIIQNDRIIGAVTHVFVNNPEKGYGIYIEWMLSECDSK